VCDQIAVSEEFLMDQQEFENALIRVEKAKLLGRVAAGTATKTEYVVTSTAMSKNPAFAAVGVIAVLLVLLAMIIWIIVLMIIAPGAAAVALVADVLKLYPPLWFTYIVAVGLSAGVYLKLYRFHGRDRAKAGLTYASFCIVITVIFLIGKVFVPSWPNYVGFFNGARNGNSLLGMLPAFSVPPEVEAEFQKQMAERQSGGPGPTENEVAPLRSEKSLPATTTSQAVSAQDANLDIAASPSDTQLATPPSIAANGRSEGIVAIQSPEPNQAAPVPTSQMTSATPGTDASQEIQAEARPSFDCAKARSSHELRVCANPSLARLDVELAARYRAAMATAQVPHVIRNEQGKWLRELVKCRNDQCLQDEYAIRLEQLRKAAAGS
jgi:uncharacterized protein YecT (DUF1311 family)